MYGIGPSGPTGGCGEMSQRPVHLKLRIAPALLVGTLLLGGCGGVQFEGKVFDAMGLSGEQKKQEAKLPDRAPLILPPKRALPAPGPRQAIADPQSWPQDPDTLRKQVALEKKKEQLRCGDYDFKRKSTSHVEDDFEEILDPMERCKGFIGRRLLGDDARADGSPDDLVNAHDDLTTKKELPSPWLSDTTKAR